MFLGPCIKAAALNSAPDLTLSSITLDQQSRFLNIALDNVGKKIITAFGVHVQVQVDGKSVSNFQEVEEMLPLVESNRQRKHSPRSWEGAILPGGHYVVKMGGFSFPPGTSPSFQVVVTGIAYSSGETWSTDPMAIATIEGGRAATTRSQAALIAVIDSAPSGDTSERLAFIRAGFQKLQAEAKASVRTTFEMSENEVMFSINQLDNIERSGDIDAGLADLRAPLQFHRDQTLPYVKQTK